MILVGMFVVVVEWVFVDVIVLLFAIASSIMRVSVISLSRTRIWINYVFGVLVCASFLLVVRVSYLVCSF